MGKASQPRTYRYEAFGIGIASELPIPGIAEADVEPDVEIRFGAVEAPELEGAPTGERTGVRDGDAYLAWKDVARFRVRGGTQVVVDPEDGVAPERIRPFLMGAVLGVVLHQRDLLVLHASAVCIDGGAVGFLGARRSGKSTTAAILHAAGHEFITDDILSIDLAPAEPRVAPGPPQLKLWPDSLRAIGRSPSDLPRIHPEMEKRDCLVESRVVSRQVPLRAVYLLDPEDEPGIRRADRHEAMSSLIGHCYCARFDYDTLAGLGISSYFLQSAELVRRVPFYRLARPRDWEIADLVEAVEATGSAARDGAGPSSPSSVRGEVAC